MMGKTHYKLGALWYATLVIVPFIPFISVKSQPLTFAGILAAALGGLMPDMDSQHSKINQINPATGLANKVIDFAEDILLSLIQLMFTMGLGILIFLNSKYLITQVSNISPSLAPVLIYGSAVLFILIGLMNRKMIKHLPIINNIYYVLYNGIDKSFSLIKRIIMFLVYGGSGIFLIFYNLSNWHDLYIYLAGFLLIAIAIFPHRSFLHSAEGLILFSIVTLYLAQKFGYHYLGWAFIIGYASHLYLADIFTNSGVPLSIIPRLLVKTKLDSIFEDYRVYKIIKRILDIRLRVPLISTGTKSGNYFEFGYVVGMIIVVIFCIVSFGTNIKLI